MAEFMIGQRIKLRWAAYTPEQSYWEIIGVGFGEIKGKAIIALMVFDEQRWLRYQAAVKVIEELYKSYYDQDEGLVFKLTRPLPKDFWYKEVLRLWVNQKDIRPVSEGIELEV